MFFRLTRKVNFTLLELLTAISIAGILFSLTFAGIARARNRAMEAKDINNLRMLMSATASYCDNYKKACFLYPDVPAVLCRLKLLPDLLFCPIPAADSKGRNYYHAYNSNGFLFHRYRGEDYEKWGFAYDEQKPWLHLPVILNNVKNPSAKLFFSEADDMDLFGTPPMIGAFYPNASFYLAEKHHSGKRGACAWGDGHVTMESGADARFMKAGEAQKRWQYLEPEI